MGNGQSKSESETDTNSLSRKWLTDDNDNERLMQLFKPEDSPLNKANQFCVSRSGLYFHAFVTVGLRETDKKFELDIVHYASTDDRLGKAKVRVVKETLTATKNLQGDGSVILSLGNDDLNSQKKADILGPLKEGKVCRVTHRTFPGTMEEREAAVERAEIKVRQQADYHGWKRNCQHLATEILTGEPGTTAVKTA